MRTAAADSAADERLVADMWERQAYDPRALGNLGLRVIFRGVPSDAGGPDYQDAILARGDREIIKGDVEFHLRASDWYRHGHHLNHQYDRVILHVVWIQDSAGTSRADGTAIPTCALGGSIRAVAAAPASGQLERHPCVDAFSNLTAPALHNQIAQAGFARLAARTDRVAAELEDHLPNQVIYAGLLEGMGYASNRETFRALASALPYGWIADLSPSQRVEAMLQASGLEPSVSCTVPARLRADDWRLARLRPANHPAVRIRGVSAVLDRLGNSPADALLEAVRDARNARSLRHLFTAREGSSTLIGSGRADEIVVSVALPFVAAYGQDSELARHWLSLYPSPPSNRWTRFMEELFAHAGHRLPVRKAVDHQGMHYLYHQYCRKEGSTGCPVCGRSVRQSEQGSVLR